MSADDVIVACAQINSTAADIRGNARRVLEAVDKATAAGADLLVLPESAISGTGCGDLERSADFASGLQEGLCRLAQDVAKLSPSLTIAFARRDAQVGSVWTVMAQGRVDSIAIPVKVLSICGQSVALCNSLEEVDSFAPIGRLDLIVSSRAERFVRGRDSLHTERWAAVARNYGIPCLVVNEAGGNDTRVLSGGSFVLDAKGQIVLRLKAFEADFGSVAIEDLKSARLPALASAAPHPVDELYAALVAAVRDYVRKSGFTDIELGLSGGVDSALVACIAVDALGPEHVHTLGLPTRYTSELSKSEASQLAENLGIEFAIRSIEPVFESFNAFLAPDFAGRAWDVTEENLQARIRGMVLMAHANKFSRLVLVTGNKSEAAAGYATLYGDTAGAFAPLADVLKSDVWALCRRINERAGFERIPSFIITRPPSAELREGQIDEATLPPYALLDRVIRGYVEEGASADALVASGLDRDLVRRVIGMIHRAEFKRRQCPLGPVVTARGFADGWSCPVTKRLDVASW